MTASQVPQEPETASISFAIEGLENDTIHLYQFKPLGVNPINSRELNADVSGSGLQGN